MIRGLPRLYSSTDDAAFEEEDTVTRSRDVGSAIRSFFDRVVAELEEKSTRVVARGKVRP